MLPKVRRGDLPDRNGENAWDWLYPVYEALIQTALSHADERGVSMEQALSALFSQE